LSRLLDDFGVCAVSGTSEVVPTLTVSVEGTMEAGDSLLSLDDIGTVDGTDVFGEKSFSRTCVDISFIEEFFNNC
jgi:hypothetical protein